MTDSVWPSVMLIDVADLRLSSVDKKFTPGEKRVRLCNYTDVYNHSVLRADLDYMEGTATEREIRNCQLKVGDVVITKDSEAPNDIGVPALVGEEIANLVCGYHLAILRPKEATLDGEFLYFAIGTNDAKRQFQKCANGITRFGLRGGDINRVTIPLPQLSEQRKIAAILSSVDDAIEKTQAVIDQVQVVKRGLMQELLTRGLPGRHSGHKQTEVGRIPENWRVIPLSDVGVWSSGGTPDKQEERFWAGTIPWVSPKDMKQARIADTIDHVSEAAIGNGTRLAPRGTILIVVRGMILAHTFPVALTERDVAFNQDIKALVSNTDYDPEFLLYWFENSSNQILNLVDTASHGTKRIPTSELYSQKAPCPRVDEQTQIAKMIRSQDTYLEAEMAHKAGLGMVKSALRSSLLTGEIQVTPDCTLA